jgi:hypothetical protein
MSSVGTVPSPSHATGLPATGAQPFPDAQQFVSINAVAREAMHVNYHRDLSDSEIIKKGERPDLFRARERRRIAGNSSLPQKPSSARPTQLKARSEQATAATDARVTMAFVDIITKTPFRQPANSVQ